MALRLLADTALAAPVAMILFVVVAPLTRDPFVSAVIAIGVAGAAQAALHRRALRAAERLGSPALPWSLWATVTTCAWILIAGLVSIGIHLANADAGVEDSLLLIPAAVVASLGITATIASVVLVTRIAVVLAR